MILLLRCAYFCWCGCEQGQILLHSEALLCCCDHSSVALMAAYFRILSPAIEAGLVFRFLLVPASETIISRILPRRPTFPSPSRPLRHSLLVRPSRSLFHPSTLFLIPVFHTPTRTLIPLINPPLINAKHTIHNIRYYGRKDKMRIVLHSLIMRPDRPVDFSIDLQGINRYLSASP